MTLDDIQNHIKGVHETADRFIVWQCITDRKNTGWPKGEKRYSVTFHFASTRIAWFFFGTMKQARTFYRQMLGMK
jgi:hypothetical protein